MTSNLSEDLGSFRDPKNRVYIIEDEAEKTVIMRGVDAEFSKNYNALSEAPFFQKFLANGQVVKTSVVASDDLYGKKIQSYGWQGVLQHTTIPFITYPYEWTFSMLKEAALLHLHLLEVSLENGWTLKDATPYNIQWLGTRPVFIDVPSFEPWQKGEPWLGYRQFCALFLTPLMLRAHLDIDHRSLLRSYLDGIPPIEAVKYFNGLNILKKGVLSHVYFPSKIDAGIAHRERDDAPSKKRTTKPHSKAMVIGLVQSLTRLVKKLSAKSDHSDWSHYDKTHSYVDIEFTTKINFVKKHVSTQHWNMVWDIGCNTGTFSKICSDHCNHVIAVDGDHNAVDQLFHSQSGLQWGPIQGANILPIVMDLSNISPGQGWAGLERKAFDLRQKPDFILCLALIHHMRISANIPNEMFLVWLRSFNANIILEFVDRHDEMVQKLLTNKKEKYDDYNRDQFQESVLKLFNIKDRQQLKNGKRELYYLIPK